MARLPRLRIVAVTIFVLLLAAASSAGERITAVAVFPAENLSAGGVPAEGIRRLLIDRLASGGIRVLGNGALDDFLSRHRVRYVAGIDAPTAEALRREAGIDAVVIVSIEMCSEAAPPKVALFVRVVSIKADPQVVWADDVGLAGDDRPGFFELGLENDLQKLLRTALDRLADSLVSYLTTGESRSRAKRASKFRPKAAYRSGGVDADRPYSVAVVPFVNLSERRNAGEILALLFIRHLASLPPVRVVDTGAVRRQLLDARIIMDGGLSLSDADTVAALIEADFVLGGRVVRYDDYEGTGRVPRVEFSAVLIERKSRRTVWSSDSYNEGRDGVRFFERGTSRTAHAMATQMVRLTAEMILGRGR